jgi:uracil-DNA glycosylase family 4
MILFENPGSPESTPQMDYTISNITLPVAQRLCIELQRRWLSDWLDREKWDKAGFVIGKTVYTTDSHKCPDPRDVEKKKRKEQARELCLDYLSEEIRLMKPKAIIAFGDYARRSVEKLEGVKFPGSLKSMTDDERVQKVSRRLYAVLPHPAGIWRNPPMKRDNYEAAIASVLAAVKEFLGES